VAARKWGVERLALTASAARVPIRKAKRTLGRLSVDAEWQSRAWDYLERSPELSFSTRWLRNALSRATLSVVDAATADDAEPVPLVHPQAEAALADLFGGPTGQSQMLGEFAVHLTVPGSCWLIGRPAAEASEDETEVDRWQVASTEELNRAGTGVALDTGDGTKTPLTDEDIIVRVWRPSERRHWLATSPVRSLLDVLSDIEGFSAHNRAVIDSRLAGNGLLLLADEIKLPPPSQDAEGLHPDPFMAALIEAMVTPISDRNSASAVVPLVATGPADAIAASKHLTFSTEFDRRILDLQAGAIGRLATGIDVPREVLLGQGDVNHWGAWLISDDALRLHVEPLLATICDALTSGYLRPAVKTLGGDPSRVALWFDTSQVVQRPNRTAEARDLTDRGALSDEAYRREAGFSEDDAPTPDEVGRRLLLKAAMVDPQLLPEVLRVLGSSITISVPPPAPAPAPTPPVDAPQVVDDPVDGPPAAPEESAP
jgi:hypothetical protein